MDKLTLLAEAIEKDFGVKLVNLHKVEEGFTSQVYTALLSEKEVFIRLNQNKRIFPVEVEGYKLFKQVGIPAPEILFFKLSPLRIGYPTMIMAKAKGEALGKLSLYSQKLDKLYFKAGQMLQRIHQIKLTGFGILKVEANKLQGTVSNWKSYWQDPNNYDTNLNYLLEEDLVTTSDFKKIMMAHEKIVNEPLDQAVLVHKDFHGDHIFTDGDEITGVIDLSSALAGDPRYDIAVSLFFQNQLQQEAFQRGYGDLALDPLIKSYLLFIAAYKLKWRHKKKMELGVKAANQTLQKFLSNS